MNPKLKIEKSEVIICYKWCLEMGGSKSLSKRWRKMNPRKRKGG